MHLIMQCARQQQCSYDVCRRAAVPHLTNEQGVAPLDGSCTEAGRGTQCRRVAWCAVVGQRY
jgi:hypothetical protein